MAMKMKKEIGTIDISHVSTPPDKHELETAKYFATLGKNIEFIERSNIPENYRPDIIMDGVEWEIKCPDGNGKHTIQRNFHKAVKQSHFIIFDLRRIRLPEKQCIVELEHEFNVRPYLKKMYIIKKNGELLEYGNH